MSTVTLKTQGGATAQLPATTIEALAGRLRGTLSRPGEQPYETSRTLWNAMIDRRPALVVRAAGAADVVAAVDFAREHGLLLSVRGGGHNIAGNAVCDGGLALDLTPMKSVRVDPTRRLARVEPGVTLGELDRETQAFALATPVGINSTTGIAGLTLGGGFGWLSRKHGLTIDNLVSADVVTADGKLVTASEKENADLFWALRGGGGNFGVVTSFEYRLHPIGPQVLSGLIVHPFDQAQKLLEGYQRAAAEAPDELTCWVVLRKAPPLPFLPPEVVGKEIVVLAMCWCGDLERGQEAVAPFRALGTPIADVVGPNPFAGWQGAFDPLLTPGARNYWKSLNFGTLSNGLVRSLLDAVGRMPTPDCEVFIGQLGAQMNRVAATATAYPHRDAEFVINVHTRWDSSAQDAECIRWARELFDAMTPHANGGVYVNFMPGDEEQRIPAGAYGPNYDRLARIKAQYDPGNLFRMNQNIRPAS